MEVMDSHREKYFHEFPSRFILFFMGVHGNFRRHLISKSNRNN